MDLTKRESFKKEKATLELQKIISGAIQEFSNRQSLITVTRCDISPDFKNVTVFVTVLPEGYEENAISFLKRRRDEIRDIVRNKFRGKRLPFLAFEIDGGEKNRQKIDQLLRDN